jgi:hypothetical protein
VDSLVRFVCVAPDHERPARGHVGDLTVHQGSWAFCPAEARSAHEWREISGGVDAQGLRRYGLTERAPTA